MLSSFSGTGGSPGAVFPTCWRTVDLLEDHQDLGHKTFPGAQIRYIAWSGEAPLACLGFGVDAWKTAPRDIWIG